MFFGNGFDYFIMQSDKNKQKVLEVAEANPIASLNSILRALNLSRRDFTDLDYLTLEREVR